MIDAAGTVPWRRHQGRLEVALVHRPRYDDWSWPKGKLDPGELHVVAAARETREETSYRAHIGRPLPQASYTVLDKAGEPTTKDVHYWAATISGGGPLVNEIDEVAWVDAVTAHARLDYARDRDQLRALIRADSQGGLDTWPLLVIRHAHAVSRGRFAGDDDRLRPLDSLGLAQAQALSPLLQAYGVRRLITSSSTRCMQTLEPYAHATGRTMRDRDDLSEEGFAQDPRGIDERITRLLRKDSPAAVCSHGPVLPTLLQGVHDRLITGSDPVALEELATAADGDALAKGEVLVLHLTRTRTPTPTRPGERARLVALERHRPRDTRG